MTREALLNTVLTEGGILHCCLLCTAILDVCTSCVYTYYSRGCIFLAGRYKITSAIEFNLTVKTFN